jgi:hypothetical protein
MAKRMMKSKLPVQQVLGVVAGSVAAGLVGKLVTKFLPNASNTVKSLVPIAAGVFLAMQKNEIVKGAGFGMVAAGGSSLVDAFVPGIRGSEIDELFLSEADDFMSEADDFMSLPADQSILSAPADQSILSGYDEDVQGMYGEEDFMNAYDGGSYED